MWRQSEIFDIPTSNNFIFFWYQDNKTARIWERNRTHTSVYSLTWCCNSPSNRRLLLLYAKQPDRSAPRCELTDVTSQPTHSSSTITTRINWLRYMERANCRLFMCAADAPTKKYWIGLILYSTEHLNKRFQSFQNMLIKSTWAYKSCVFCHIIVCYTAGK